jgi:hypothetical protein
MRLFPLSVVCVMYRTFWELGPLQSSNAREGVRKGITRLHPSLSNETTSKQAKNSVLWDVPAS